MKNSKRISSIPIRLKILGITVPIILFCILLVFSLFEYNAHSTATFANEQKTVRVMDIQTKVLAEPLWNLADEQIQLTLEVLIEADPDIYKVIVYNENKKQVAEARKSKVMAGNHVVRERPIQYGTSGQTRTIGFLEVTFGDQSLTAERNSRLLLVAALAVLLVLAVIAGTLVAVNKVVGVPMRLLLNSINQTANNQRNRVNFNSNDEMGVVIAAYNAMLTKEQQNQKELKVLNEELEQRVALRTRELSIARDEANQANQSKSAFLATMSHEIRTPLNGITGMSILLEGTKLTDEQREFSQTIRNASDTLLSIINDILDFSKVEAGAIELEQIPINLTETIENAVELVSPKASEKKLELICSIDDSVPEGILGDSTRLNQILLNLMNNAVKFTESGEVMLAVTLQTADTLRFTVTDTGIGIPKDRMNKLFRSFSQVDASTTRRYGGSGLGLVITKKLIELMGGEITVQSTPGKGTTFSFIIPFEAAQIPVVADSSEQLALVNGRKVLVVDDNRTNRLILCKKFQKWGMDVVEVASSFEALAAIEQQKQHFDLYIIDFAMPEMDGIELVAEIQQRWPESPEVILYTSISPSDLDLRQRLAEVKLSTVLLKPAKTSKILAAVARTLSKEETTGSHITSSLDTFESEKALHILLVDDNKINRKVGYKLLKRIGYEPDIVDSGMEAIAACQQKVYDLVLMDIEMPDMNGITATQEIRKILSPENMPYFVAVTANAMVSDRQHYLSSGMDGYLSKPINLDEFIAALNDAEQYRMTLRKMR
ncbi:MAG: response regulator [Thiolinea sp.]